jgi:Na+/H+ antiporter NhaD/arsenite permease-like protein
MHDHTSETERESGQLLIRSIVILLFSFEVPLKKKLPQKKQKKKKKKNERQQRMGFVCVFLLFMWWCFVITFVSRLTSLAQSSLGPAYYHR